MAGLRLSQADWVVLQALMEVLGQVLPRVQEGVRQHEEEQGLLELWVSLVQTPYVLVAVLLDRRGRVAVLLVGVAVLLLVGVAVLL